jgi:cytochrome d ubiquinol oxidase subunit I
VVYLAVFGAGVFYILRLMSHPPEAGIVEDIGPARAAGFMRRDDDTSDREG